MRGTVVDATDRAVSGVVVALVDSTQTVVARGLSNDRGEYRVAAQRAGRYRLRTLRIGFQPTESRSITLEAGTIAVERLVLDGVRVSLEAIRIVERSYDEMVRDGANLSAADKAKLVDLNAKLEGLFSAFSSKLLGDEKLYTFVTDKAELAGLAPGFVASSSRPCCSPSP